MKSYKDTTENNDSNNQAVWYRLGTLVACFRLADRRIEHWFDHMISEIEGLHQIHPQENREIK